MNKQCLIFSLVAIVIALSSVASATASWYANPVDYVSLLGLSVGFCFLAGMSYKPHNK